MTNPVSLERDGPIGLLRISHPPVNGLSSGVVAGLIDAFDRVEADATIEALVIFCDGNTFVAGGDIKAFDAADFSARAIADVFARLEASRRPVVAALHGTVLGGGLELALACHYRVAQPDTRFGLPEVQLGLLPGALGTQRLPRLVGAPFALDMMLSGRMVHATDALAHGIVDTLRNDTPQASGSAYARELLAAQAPARRLSERTVPQADLAPDFFAEALASAERQAAYPAHAAIVRCVQAAATLGFAEGARVEAREFDTLRLSAASQALRHLFFAQRQAAKIPGLPADLAKRPVKSVGIVGAGTMGGGIAMCFANAGIPTLLVETSAAALERGLGLVRANYEASVAKGRLTAEEMRDRMALLRGTLDDTDLADCDLVIEAVFENMDLKMQVCERLGKVCKASAIIATNTSTLNVDVLAEATGRAGDVVGMHFFSPANVMRLLEVVRGAKTAPDVLATVMDVARRIGKVPVVSGVCYGFIGNRMLEVYMREAEFLLMEGASPAQIDGAVEGLGMAMGPCRMLDMAGLDVGAKTVIEYGKAGGLPPDDSYRAMVRRMFELGRFGQKTGVGYYRYDGRKPVADLETDRIAAGLAAAHGIARRADITPQEIVERLLYPLINEGVKILEEGIAYRPGDIDVVWTSGYGFPDHRGGPLSMADRVGLPEIVARLSHYARVRGNPHG